MLLSEIFAMNRIKVDLTSTSKEELFAEVVDFLQENGEVEDKELILKELWDREKMLDTTIAPRIAFPHASIPGFRPPCGVIGVSKEGIEYGGEGSAPVHIVLLLIDDRNDARGHTALLQSVARFIGGPNFFNRMMRCKEPGHVFDLILEDEQLEKL